MSSLSSEGCKQTRINIVSLHAKHSVIENACMIDVHTRFFGVFLHWYLIVVIS